MLDVRDLEIPAVEGAWERAPDALRSACAVLVPLVAVAGLRVWMVLGRWPDFERAYGRSRHLDMSSHAGWVVAGLHTPGQGGALLDVGVVLVVSVLVAATLRRVHEARPFALALLVGAAVDSAASLAYAVPWWYLVASVLLAGVALVQVVLLTRPTTTMHLRPEPVSLRELTPGRPCRHLP